MSTGSYLQLIGSIHAAAKQNKDIQESPPRKQNQSLCKPTCKQKFIMRVNSTSRDIAFKGVAMVQ